MTLCDRLSRLTHTIALTGSTRVECLSTHGVSVSVSRIVKASEIFSDYLMSGERQAKQRHGGRTTLSAQVAVHTRCTCINVDDQLPVNMGVVLVIFLITACQFSISKYRFNLYNPSRLSVL